MSSSIIILCFGHITSVDMSALVKSVDEQHKRDQPAEFEPFSFFLCVHLNMIPGGIHGDAGLKCPLTSQPDGEGE